MGPRWQERVEASWVGRSVISAFLLVTLAFLIAVNLFDSEIKRDVTRVGRPYLNALGLDQMWGVFAPDPRRTDVDLIARITYEDGTKRDWHYPREGPLFAAYWDYRWRKWAKWMVVYSRQDLRQPLAAWLAKRERALGREPLRVVLVARWRDVPPPPFRSAPKPTKLGPTGGAWKEKQFFSVWVTPVTLGELTVG